MNNNKDTTDADKWQQRVLLDEIDEYLRPLIKGLTPQGYVRLRGKNDILLHRRLMQPPKGMFIDHINHDKLDNRRSNLRICTPAQNTWNREVVTSSSGLKGVHWEKQTKHWKAAIRGNGRQITLGRFLTKEKAALAYNAAARKYHGEFAFINEGY